MNNKKVKIVAGKIYESLIEKISEELVDILDSEKLSDAIMKASISAAKEYGDFRESIPCCWDGNKSDLSIRIDYAQGCSDSGFLIINVNVFDTIREELNLLNEDGDRKDELEKALIIKKEIKNIDDWLTGLIIEIRTNDNL